MTKNFWLSVMLFSLIGTAGTGLFLYKAIQEKATVDVPLQTVNSTPSERITQFPTESTSKVMSTSSTDPRPVIDKESTPLKMDTEKTATPPSSKKEDLRKQIQESAKQRRASTRNILFSLYSSSAKEVFIVGDFNEWYREPLQKKGKNLWTRSVKLSPGTYNYAFVVNGRRIKDPNNTKISRDGKASILSVKPITKK